MGNSAFKDERYDDAITYYSQAIERNDNDFVCYANRSAAYLKKNELVKALEDAGRCTAIKPSYNKGHIRKVAVYHASKNYTDAVRAYEEGLKHCPEDTTLQRGLKAATKKQKEQGAQPLGGLHF